MQYTACHAAVLLTVWLQQHVLSGFILPHRQVKVDYVRVAILTTDLLNLML